MIFQRCILSATDISITSLKCFLWLQLDYQPDQLLVQFFWYDLKLLELHQLFQPAVCSDLEKHTFSVCARRSGWVETETKRSSAVGDWYVLQHTPGSKHLLHKGTTKKDDYTLFNSYENWSDENI